MATTTTPVAIVERQGVKAITVKRKGGVVEVPDAVEAAVAERARERFDIDVIPSGQEIGMVTFDPDAAEVADIRWTWDPTAGLEPQVTEQRGLPIGTDTRAGAFQRASEQARQRREQQAERAEREEGQMDIETAAGTRRLDQWTQDREQTHREIEELGLGEGALPDRNGDDGENGENGNGDADTGPFDADERGRIKAHARAGNLAPLLRSIGVTTRMNQPALFAEAGIETPADLVDHFDRFLSFERVEGVGPASNDLLVAAMPMIREAVEEGGR